MELKSVLLNTLAIQLRDGPVSKDQTATISTGKNELESRGHQLSTMEIKMLSKSFI